MIDAELGDLFVLYMYLEYINPSVHTTDNVYILRFKARLGKKMCHQTHKCQATKRILNVELFDLVTLVKYNPKPVGAF